MVKKAMVLAGLAVAAALVYVQVAQEPAMQTPVATPPSAPASAPVASTSAPEAASSVPAVSTPVAPAPQGQASTTGPTMTQRKAWPAPDLTRALPEPGMVKIGDRDWAILGTRDVQGASGKLTTLVMRDEVSGQLAYSQSALRFVLSEGQDYDGFIRSRPNATRLFANPLYGDMGVDPSRIAAEYAALASDPRVAKVMFIPLEVRPVPK